MRITKMIMVETGTYDDMVLRPYQSSVDAHGLMMYKEATQDGTILTPESLSGVAGHLMRPSSRVHGQAPIENGWGTRRLRFMIEIESDKGWGAKNIQIMTGYTNYVGVTATGAIDPQMHLSFNNSITVRATAEFTPSGTQYRQAVADASQIMPVVNMGSTAYSPQNIIGMPVIMRPVDVVSGMYMNALNDPNIQDLSTSLAVSPKKSRRDNGNAATYMARTMKAMTAAHEQDMDYAVGQEDILQKVKGSLKEPMVSNDDFLSNIMQYTDYLHTSSVSYGDLCRTFPETDSVNTVVLRGTVQKTSPTMPSERGMGSTWLGSDNETIATTILTQSVPSIMVELMLTKISFAATNETLNGQFAIEMRDAAGFSKNVDMAPYLQRFIDRMYTEVLNDVSNNNQMTFRLQMLVDILGDTYVTISIGGGPDTDFVLPSFCDALMSPVIGGGPGDLSLLATDLEQIHSNSATQYQHTPVRNTHQHESWADLQAPMNNGGMRSGYADDLI